MTEVSALKSATNCSQVYALSFTDLYFEECMFIVSLPTASVWVNNLQSADFALFTFSGPLML